MLFALICTDRPGALATRLANRPAHLAHLEAHATNLVHAGPLLDDAGDPCGSLFFLDMPDRAAAEAFAAADPFATAGVFESSVIHLTRSVFKDGARVA